MKRQQRKLELNSVRNYKQNLAEIEERRLKAIELESGKARKGQNDFLTKERETQKRQVLDKSAADQDIVESLYSLEVKLQVGQQRAKNWQEDNIIGKA